MRRILSLLLLVCVLLAGCSAMSTSAIQDLQEESYQDGYKQGKEDGYKEGFAAGQQTAVETILPGSSGETPPPLDDYVKDYVVNTNTGKFHYPTCSSVDEMYEHNKKFVTTTRDQLIADGYSPCGRCHP